VHVPDDKWEKLDAKAIEGYFVSLPQNRKGYIVSNSWNPLRVYVSCDDTGQKSEAGDATETTVEDTPTQLRRSTRIKCIPVWDDDHRFSTTSYSHLKSSGDPNETENSALTMTNPTSYQDAISRANAIH